MRWRHRYPERPLDPEALTLATAGAGFQCGGWKIFSSGDRWRYRSNEFVNDSYDHCRAALMRQAIALPVVLEGMGVPASTFTRYAVTMEKMLGIWPFRHKTGTSL